MRLTVAGPYTAYLMSLAPLGTLPRQDVRGETMRPLDEMIALQVETDNNGEGWTDTTTPRTDKPVRFFPRRSFPETGWRSHVWTPRDAESAERHAAMLA